MNAQHPDPPQGGHSVPVLVDRRLPPEISLLHLLARLKLSGAQRRRALVTAILALPDPPLDGDRPAFKTWLACSLALPEEADARLEEDQEEELPASDQVRLAEADQLHSLVGRLDGQPRRQRRLLEQELLLRSSLEEDWQFHRAKWRYLSLQAEQTGTMLAPAEAARRARAAGIFFHPDQLRPGPCHRWFGIRRALEMVEPASWLDLLSHLRRNRPVELALPAGLWVHLRPWLAYLVGGSGLSFVEYYTGSLPELPPAPSGRRGLLVVHGDGELEDRLEEWCRTATGQGWGLVMVRPPQATPAAWLNRVAAGETGEEWVRRHVLAGHAPEQVVPLRDFVRQVERSYILDVLGLLGGVKTRACEHLQISRQTLYTKLGVERADS